MSSGQCWSIGVALALAFAVPLSAQQKASGDRGLASFTSTMSVVAPSIHSSAQLAVQPSVVPFLEPFPAREGQSRNVAIEPTVASLFVPFPPQQGQGRHVAMMVVGGAGLVAGSLIDGDTGTIVMAGSAVIGLIGLYRYLR